MKRVDQPMIDSFLNELKGASHEQSTGEYIGNQSTIESYNVWQWKDNSQEEGEEEGWGCVVEE